MLDIVNNTVRSTAFDTVSTRQPALEATDGVILIRTANRDSPKIGNLSAATSWIRKSGGRKFQELLNVTLAHGYSGKFHHKLLRCRRIFLM
jgi:hypothetical protein